MRNKEAPKSMPLKLNITSEAQLKIGGKMNETDAGKVGQLLALSLPIIAVGISVSMILLAASKLIH